MHEAVIMGRRYTGPEAHAAGIVQQVVPGTQLLNTAVDFATKLGAQGIDQGSLGNMKEDMYSHIEINRQEELRSLAKL